MSAPGSLAEACGQRWTDTRLDTGLITVAKQLVVNGWEVYEDDPKTDAGARTIALDSDTVRVLKRHRAQQDKDREAAVRLVPRARDTSEDTRPEVNVQPGQADEPVPDDADPSGDIREINSPSAHAPLTQTAPDEESEAE